MLNFTDAHRAKINDILQYPCIAQHGRRRAPLWLICILSQSNKKLSFAGSFKLKHLQLLATNTYYVVLMSYLNTLLTVWPPAIRAIWSSSRLLRTVEPHCLDLQKWLFYPWVIEATLQVLNAASTTRRLCDCHLSPNRLLFLIRKTLPSVRWTLSCTDFSHWWVSFYHSSHRLAIFMLH